MDKLELLRACGEATVMIMGMSFVIGSLFTIFILVMLDLYRCRNTKDETKE